MTGNRDRNVPRNPVPASPPQGARSPEPGQEGRVPLARVSRARDYTAPPAVRTRKSLSKVADIQDITDPMQAVNRMWNYIQSVLKQAENRNMPSAYGWCWFLIHFFDLIGHHIENRTDPGPWFRSRDHWQLSGDGRMPIRPLAEILAIITRTETAHD